jgi:PAS domain S-box-containing protein
MLAHGLRWMPLPALGTIFFAAAPAPVFAIAERAAIRADEHPDVWQTHPVLTFAVAFVLTLLLGIVIALLSQWRGRRRRMRALSERLEFERLVSELSATLIDVEPEGVNEVVNRGLKRVLEAMGLDRCLLFVYLPEKGEARATHEARARGVERLRYPVQTSEAPYIFERLRLGETVALDDVSRDLPREAERDRKTTSDRGHKSLLLIPVTVSDRLVRGISFHATRHYRTWSPDFVPRLRLVGQVLVSALVGKRAEAALRASEERYREVVNSQADLICRYLPDTTLTFVNEAYCRYFGKTREELIGRPFLELIPEAVREATRRHVQSLAANPRVEANEHEVLLPDGSVGWQQWVDHAVRGRDGRVIEFQGLGRDLTDRKRAQEAERRLARAGRLALLGELTASIAHEINQPLGAILSNADAAEMLLDARDGRPEEIRAILADIRREDLRASEVIRRVRSLVRGREMERRDLDVNEVVAEVLGLADGECRRRRVLVQTDLAEDLPPVLGDRVWLQQLLLNLIVNGLDAMSDTDSGSRRLALSTRRDGPGDWVEVAVVDTGHGISEELLPRLFDSFVTTRDEGMGLGLSISRSIVEAHGGRIRAENNADGGATLRFNLPAAAGTRAGPPGRVLDSPALRES